MAQNKGAHSGQEVISWHGQQEGAFQPAADANQETMGRGLRGLDGDRRSLWCQAAQICFGFNMNKGTPNDRLLDSTHC